MRMDAAVRPAGTSPCCTTAGLPTPTACGMKLSVGIQPRPRRLGLVAGRQQRGSFRRGLQRLGDHHRDRLVGITHAVVLQQVEPEHERVQLRVRIQRELRLVGGRHDLDHARMRLCRGEVQEGDPPARDASHRQDGVEHAGRVIVGCIARAAGDLQDAVTAGHRLADIRAVSLMSQSWGKRDFRHGRKLRERGRRETPAVPTHDPACQPQPM